MKAKFTLIYILTFIFLFNFINVKITNAEETNEKIEITHILNGDLFVKGLLVELNDIYTLNEEISQRKSFMSFVTGYNDNEDEALINIESFDTSQIDITKEGIYQIKVKLIINEEFSQDFFISEDTANITIPVLISDPNYYDIFLRGILPNYLTISYLKPAEADGEILILQSPTEITYKELIKKDWNIYSTITQGATSFDIDRSIIALNTHYYFRLKIGDEYSNILHIIDEGTYLHSTSTGRDRDSGDTHGNDLPDQIQPSPEPPTVEEIKDDNIIPPTTDEGNTIKPPPTNKPINPNSSSNPIRNNISLPYSSSNNISNNLTIESENGPLEFFGDNKDIISGYRLKLMFETNNGTASFSKNGITVNLPKSFLDDFKISNDDSFCIEIKKISDSEFTLLIAINNQEVIDIPQIKFMIPYAKAYFDSKLSILNDSINELNLDNYNETQNIVYFTTDKTGTFKIIETNNNTKLPALNKETKNNNFIIYLIATLIILFLALLVFFRCKKVSK